MQLRALRELARVAKCESKAEGKGYCILKSFDPPIVLELKHNFFLI